MIALNSDHSAVGDHKSCTYVVDDVTVTHVEQFEDLETSSVTSDTKSSSSNDRHAKSAPGNNNKNKKWAGKQKEEARLPSAGAGASAKAAAPQGEPTQIGNGYKYIF